MEMQRERGIAYKSAIMCVLKKVREHGTHSHEDIVALLEGFLTDTDLILMDYEQRFDNMEQQISDLKRKTDSLEFNVYES